jgi:hypothetical protein
MTHEMGSIKMRLETRIILKELIGLSHLIANVAFVVFLIEMFVKFHDIVETKGTTKFAQRMTRKTGGVSVSLGEMNLDTLGCKPTEFGYKVSFIDDA